MEVCGEEWNPIRQQIADIDHVLHLRTLTTLLLYRSRPRSELQERNAQVTSVRLKDCEPICAEKCSGLASEILSFGVIWAQVQIILGRSQAFRKKIRILNDHHVYLPTMLW